MSCRVGILFLGGTLWNVSGHAAVEGGIVETLAMTAVGSWIAP